MSIKTTKAGIKIPFLTSPIHRTKQALGLEESNMRLSETELKELIVEEIQNLINTDGNK